MASPKTERGTQNDLRGRAKLVKKKQSRIKGKSKGPTYSQKGFRTRAVRALEN